MDEKTGRGTKYCSYRLYRLPNGIAAQSDPSAILCS